MFLGEVRKKKKKQDAIWKIDCVAQPGSLLSSSSSASASTFLRSHRGSRQYATGVSGLSGVVMHLTITLTESERWGLSCGLERQAAMLRGKGGRENRPGMSLHLLQAVCVGQAITLVRLQGPNCPTESRQKRKKKEKKSVKQGTGTPNRGAQIRVLNPQWKAGGKRFFSDTSGFEAMSVFA
ncbi:hypothetical protein LY76DRAFT_417732 [Colletotrichum caudatum]|nr:hypothetical protein LY76DRAFT_417732 [Colletotrichum caudatum]